MRSYYIHEIKKDPNGDLILAKKDFFHLFTVCRHQTNQNLKILTQNRKVYIVCVKNIKKNSARLNVLEEKNLPPKKAPFIGLAVSLCKTSYLDQIVKQAVELELDYLQFFYSDHSYFKKKIPLEDKKIKRWEKIIFSSMAQSESSYPVQILKIKSLKSVVSDLNKKENCLLFGLERQGKEALLKEHLDKKNSYKNYWIFIGSEGGFSTQEVDFFKQNKLKGFHLPGPVLRVDTACVSISSILKYKLNLW